MQIANPYAPLQLLSLPETKQAGVELWLKREDLSHPFISGNKWRKLKYHLLNARQKQKNILVTFGGAYSNHLLATACAAASYGFKAVGFVRGDEVTNHLLQLCKLFGMTLYFVNRTDYANNKEGYVQMQLKHQLNDLYVIQEGGSGTLGEIGVAELVNELDANTNVVCCAIGTGSTFAGLLKGVHSNKLPFQLHGIPVLKGLTNQLHQQFQSYQTPYVLHDQYHFGGYAKTNAILHEFVARMASETGVLFDYVYEAKMMFGLLDLIQQGYFKQGTRIVALHNGGTLGIISMLHAADSGTK